MAQERTPQAATGSDAPTAAEVLRQAAQSLAASAAQMQQALQQMPGRGDVADGAAHPAATGGFDRPGAATPAEASAPPALKSKSQEAARFYEGLEQAGQLLDVDEKTDLSTLPSRVTHVRRPDGSVQRIGFSASPYAKE